MLLIFFYRSWRFQPLKLASMAMLNVTLLRLIFSMEKSLKILFLLPTTVMYAVFLSNLFYINELFITEAFSWFKCLFPLHCRFPTSPVLTTSWLISLRMDLFVPCSFTFFKTRLIGLLSNLFLKFQVSLLTENGNTKDDLKLPTDDSLLTQVSWHFFLPSEFD